MVVNMESENQFNKNTLLARILQVNAFISLEEQWINSHIKSQ